MAATVIKTIDISATSTVPIDIAFDGKYLWWIDYTGAIIVQMDRAGSIIKTINVAATDTKPGGITTDGKYIWWTGITNQNIYQILFFT